MKPTRRSSLHRLPAVKRAPSTPSHSRVSAFQFFTSMVLPWITAATLAGWSYYLWRSSGGNDWTINLSTSTEVLPYTDNTRLLVVNIKANNNARSEVEFDPPDDSFSVTVTPVPSGRPAGTSIDTDKPAPIAKADLLPKDGWVFLPGAEFHQVASFVVPVGATLSVKCDLERSKDYVEDERIVVVRP